MDSADKMQLVVVPLDEVRRQNPDGIERRPVWITSAEWEEAEILTDRTRRWQWLAGRWAVKQALQTLFQVLRGEATANQLASTRAGQDQGKISLEHFSVRSRDRHGRPGRPRLVAPEAPRQVFLSIAHHGQQAVAVASLNGPVGVDVVAGQTDRRHLPVLDLRIWAATEAAYKTGLSGEDSAAEAWKIRLTNKAQFVAELSGGGSPPHLIGQVWEDAGHVYAVCGAGELA